MYKVFFNDVLIILAKPEEVLGKKSIAIKGDEQLFEYVLEANRKGRNKRLVFVHHDRAFLSRWFRSFFVRFRAGGGLVLNNDNKLLLIHRKGKWDLPKGKLEGNETKKQGAKREVEEETGVGNLKIVEKLETTYHVFFRSKIPCLKVTYWYVMKTDFSGELVPQEEEGIEKVKWVSLNKLDKYRKDSYKSLSSLFDRIEYYPKEQ